MAKASSEALASSNGLAKNAPNLWLRQIGFQRSMIVHNSLLAQRRLWHFGKLP